MRRAILIIGLISCLLVACGDKPQSVESSMAEEEPEIVNAPAEEAPQADADLAEEEEETEFIPWGCDDFSV